MNKLNIIESDKFEKSMLQASKHLRDANIQGLLITIHSNGYRAALIPELSPFIPEIKKLDNGFDLAKYPSWHKQLKTKGERQCTAMTV